MPTRARLRIFIRSDPLRRGPGWPGSGGWNGGRQEVGSQGEEGEQDDQDDRELPQPALDAAATAVDGGVATEGATEPRPAGLEQHRERERDADDELADGQDGIHG